MTALDKDFSKKCDDLMKNLPKPLTQTEKIVWHKYPEDKPVEETSYLVHVQGMEERWFTTDEWYHNEWINHLDDEILSWAELPKGVTDDHA